MLTEMVNTALKKHKASERGTFHPLDGWRPLVGAHELPSLSDDMTRLFASYGFGSSPKHLVRAIRRTRAYRARIHLEEGSCGFIFALPAGSFLVAFHHSPNERRRVSGYVMGDACLADCSELITELIDVFEGAALPPVSRAAELL